MTKCGLEQTYKFKINRLSLVDEISRVGWDKLKLGLDRLEFKLYLDSKFEQNDLNLQHLLTLCMNCHSKPKHLTWYKPKFKHFIWPLQRWLDHLDIWYNLRLYHCSHIIQKLIIKFHKHYLHETYPKNTVMSYNKLVNKQDISKNFQAQRLELQPKKP